MSKDLYQMMVMMKEDTFNNYEVAEYHDAIKVFTSSDSAVLLQWGVLESGMSFSRTWFTDAALQPICEWPFGESVKGYITYMLDINK